MRCFSRGSPAGWLPPRFRMAAPHAPDAAPQAKRGSAFPHEEAGAEAGYGAPERSAGDPAADSTEHREAIPPEDPAECPLPWERGEASKGAD